MKMRIVSLALVAVALVAQPVLAETKVFKNGGNFNTDSKWTPVGVPGAQDTAVFTNDSGSHVTIDWTGDAVNANTYFTYTKSGATILDEKMDIGGYKYWVTNEFVTSPDLAHTTKVYLLTGHLAVTNAEGTATLEVGRSGYGYFNASGGILDVDRIVATNGANSNLQFGNGTQTVWHGIVYDGGGWIPFNSGVCTLRGGTSLLADGFYTGYGGTFAVDGPSTIATSTAAIWPAYGGAASYFVVTNGATFVCDAVTYIGGAAAGLGNVTVAGSNSLFDANNTIYLGRTGPSNTLTVADGGTLDMPGGQIVLGDNSACIDNHLHITGEGSKVVLQSLNYKLGSSTVLIEDGGMLDDVYQIRTVNGANTDCVVTNIGGIFQFDRGNPSLLVDDPSDILLRDGTMGFRDNVNIPVRQGGTVLTNITYEGTNAMRLQNASTATPSPDDYVFETGRGPTNYYRLELRDNSTFNGSLTIGGSGGELALIDGASTAADNLTLQSGATLEVEINATNDYSSLDAQGTVTLGGATLRVVLTAKPVKLYPYRIIDKTSVGAVSGTFASDTVAVEFGGKPYELFVDYAAGDGNDVVLMYRSRGTVVTIN